jgi:oligosaccharide repeat unit polymerase
MNLHPAVLMVVVWLGAVALFFLLPFQLEGTRVMTLYGILILFLFIGVFCAGALAAARPQPQRPRPDNLGVDFTLTDRVLMVVGVIAVLSSLLDVQGRNLLDLADAYQVRSDRAGGLLAGAQSDSTIWFQIAFLTYPAGYVYIVREVAFRPHPVVWRIAAFGLGPVVLTSLAMGGRAPLFYAIIMLVYGFALRKQVFKPRAKHARVVAAPGGLGRRTPFRLTAPAKAGIALIGAIAVLYFVQVFFARADVAGGVDSMFGVASQYWGVNFNGRFSGIFFGLFGTDGTYLIFIFTWYLIQGLVMSNAIFSEYQGSMLFGAYGIDLVSALMRRLNGEFLANGYAELLQMNVYGFLPSAFGSLFVDLKFFGLIPCLIWGWLAGKVYGHVRQGRDPRWLLVVPFITVGIFFSLINSPIGFSNGFVTHIWLVIAFMTARVRTRLPVPRHNPAVLSR